MLGKTPPSSPSSPYRQRVEDSGDGTLDPKNTTMKPIGARNSLDEMQTASDSRSGAITPPPLALSPLTLELKKGRLERLKLTQKLLTSAEAGLQEAQNKVDEAQNEKEGTKAEAALQEAQNRVDEAQQDLTEAEAILQESQKNLTVAKNSITAEITPPAVSSQPAAALEAALMEEDKLKEALTKLEAIAAVPILGIPALATSSLEKFSLKEQEKKELEAKLKRAKARVKEATQRLLGSIPETSERSVFVKVDPKHGLRSKAFSELTKSWNKGGNLQEETFNTMGCINTSAPPSTLPVSCPTDITSQTAPSTPTRKETTLRLEKARTRSIARVKAGDYNENANLLYIQILSKKGSDSQAKQKKNKAKLEAILAIYNDPENTSSQTQGSRSIPSVSKDKQEKTQLSQGGSSDVKDKEKNEHQDESESELNSTKTPSPNFASKPDIYECDGCSTTQTKIKFTLVVPIPPTVGTQATLCIGRLISRGDLETAAKKVHLSSVSLPLKRRLRVPQTASQVTLPRWPVSRTSETPKTGPPINRPLSSATPLGRVAQLRQLFEKKQTS